MTINVGWAEIGLQPGDLILAVNSRPVHNVMDAHRILSQNYGFKKSVQSA